MRTIFHAADGRPSGSSLQAVEQDWNKSETLIFNIFGKKYPIFSESQNLFHGKVE
jgi:hypothetical protein